MEDIDIVEFAKQKGLMPERNFFRTKWTAICPNSAGKHRLFLSSSKQTFKCIHCNRKGTSKELQSWIWKLDQEQLSQFMKELQTGGIQTQETYSWWMNRY